MACENERGIRVAGALGHGSAGFLLSMAVPGSTAAGRGTRPGMAALASSQQPGVPGSLRGGWAVGRHGLAGGHGHHFSLLNTKLLHACREADQPEVSLCSFRPIFTVSE